MKKKSTKRLGIKLLLSVIYLMIITILFVFGYKIYNEYNEPHPYQETESTDEYAYIEVSRMSDKFAYSKDSNVGIHFVVEKEETGIWHTYLVAINEKKIKKYQKLIDYSNGKTKKIPRSVKVYGYPVNINDQIKEMAIKNINNFLPSTNEVKITSDNYEDYLTNSYLDTTKHREENIPPILIIIASLFLIVVLLLILLLIDKDVFVDKIDNKIKRKRKKWYNKQWKWYKWIFVN